MGCVTKKPITRPHYTFPHPDRDNWSGGEGRGGWELWEWCCDGMVVDDGGGGWVVGWRENVIDEFNIKPIEPIIIQHSPFWTELVLEI